MQAETPSMETRSPRIVFPHRIMEAITLLCGKNALEWTLFGKTRQEGQDFIVEDLYVPSQSNTGANTTISEEGMGEMLEWMINSNENPKDWNLWIHSHNKMGCFWSGTDHGQMDSFGTDGPDFFLSVVVSTAKMNNGYCDALGAISFYKPVNARISGIEIKILEEEKDETYFSELQATLDKKETRSFYSPSSYHIPEKGYSKGFNKDWWKDHKRNNKDLYDYPEEDEYDYSADREAKPKTALGDKEGAETIPVPATEEEKKITRDQAEILLDDLILEIFSLAGLGNEQSNVFILERVKELHRNYYAIYFFDKEFIKIAGKKYESKKPEKEFKRRLSPHFEANSKALLALIKHYNCSKEI